MTSRRLRTRTELLKLAKWIFRTELGFLIFLLFLPSHAHAASGLCDFYKKFIPGLAKNVCSGGKSARPAGANSTVSGGFNLNPGSTPVEPSPYGIETIDSFLRRPNTPWRADFAIIKGYKKFGAGVSTSATYTFYGNDIVGRREGEVYKESFESSEEERGHLPNINLGTAFALNPSQKGTLAALKLGVTGRYNKITNSTGGGLGLIGSNDILTYGLGVTRERVTNSLPPMYFASAMIGVQLIFLELEYNWLRNYGAETLSPIHIGTATLSIWRLMLTGAIRRVDYRGSGSITQQHFGVQANITPWLYVGYLYNYIPGANSVALQLFF